MKINKPNFVKDDHAQIGSIFVLVLGLLGIAFLYIEFGYFMNFLYNFANGMLQNTTFHTPQASKDGLNALFAYWWAIPIIAVIFFLIYIIRAGIKSRTSEAY